MNYMKLRKILYAALALGLLIPGFGIGVRDAKAESLVILHTNDTHSLIDPDGKGEGGVLQRKAIIDSVRAAERNVLLVDAGDIVQGTLYFKFFRGEVEYPLMNMMGYDVQILGNHEFDNGLEELASHYSKLNASRLSSNYDFSSTPMAGLLEPYSVMNIGDKRIGFLGLNIDPESIIAANNYEGLGYKDVIAAADSIARFLRDKEKCDLVVALSHIGVYRSNDKPIDYDVARETKDIDIIIGGHSHTVILPDNGSAPDYPSIVMNADGRPVLVAQTGKYGKQLGYIKVDLDRIPEMLPSEYDHQLIPVTDRFPVSLLDPEMEAFIRPYRDKLKALDEHVIGHNLRDMDSTDPKGSYANFVADFAKWYGDLKRDSLTERGMNIPKVDFAMMNIGGIRHDAPEGDFTEGQLLATFPFSNRIVLHRIKGADFIEAMRIAARKGGEAISNEVRVVTDGERDLVRVVVNGEEMDPEKEYLMATIDYLAWGNDDFKPLAKGETLWSDSPEMSAAMMRYITFLTSQGLPIDGDPRPRFY